MTKPTIGERFWSKVAVPADLDGCWIWTAALSHGYGAFGIGTARVHPAHRIAYEMTYGLIEPGLVVDHICHNPPCVNPRHLQAVTQKQNCENLSGPGRGVSGIRGVERNCKSSPPKQWLVQVKHNGRKHHGGFFDDLAEAAVAAVALRNRLFTNNVLDRTKGVYAKHDPDGIPDTESLTALGLTVSP